MDAKGVLTLLGASQRFQITDKYIELWQTSESGLNHFIKRWRKANKWVTNDGGTNMYML